VILGKLKCSLFLGGVKVFKPYYKLFLIGYGLFIARFIFIPVEFHSHATMACNEDLPRRNSIKQNKVKKARAISKKAN